MGKAKSKAVKRRKPEDERKDGFIRLRVTHEQKALIDQVAKGAGISTSAWAVERLLRAARAERKEQGAP